MSLSLSDLRELSISYNIPFVDILFINLNRQGVKFDSKYDRIRFYFRLFEELSLEQKDRKNTWDYFFAVPTHSGFSNYFLRDGTLFLENEAIGKVYGTENDTCDSTYSRRNGTVFNLNALTKSSCHGCLFCHIYKQFAKDINELGTENFIIKEIKIWLNKHKKSDLSYLYSVDIVTGCFGNEKEALKHLFLIREIFSRFNFLGTLFYLGSEITSKKAFNELEKLKPFTLCLSLECFTNRKKILREHKARISLEAAKEILNKSKERGFGTHFSYVLGLEPLELILEKMEDFLPFINKLPVVNIFQPHTPAQRKLLVHEACKLEYFLEARKELEKIFYQKGFRPRTWGNYRCLWYLKFKNEYLDGPRLP